MATLSQRLGTFIHGVKYEQLPSDVVEKTKNLILDTLGPAFSGREFDAQECVVELVKDIGSSGNSTVIGHDLKVFATDAAFANTVLMHSMVHDEYSYANDAHAATVIIPAALAVAEHENNSGKELVTAVAAGYEIANRIGRPITPQAMIRGFRGTSLFGVFGAAVAAGILMKLNAEQNSHAIGFAANFAQGLKECTTYGGHDWLFQAAIASKNGVIAALLAKKGMRAVPTAMEGPNGFYHAYCEEVQDINSILLKLGTHYTFLKDAQFKPLPWLCGGGQMPPAVAVVKLMEKHNFKAENVDKIVCHTSNAGLKGLNRGITNKPPFLHHWQCAVSTPFSVAMALLHKRIPMEVYLTKAYNDQAIIEQANKVECVGEDFEHEQSRVDVYLKDGRILHGEHRGYPQPSRDGILEKFTAHASKFLPAEKIVRIIDQIDRLDDVGNVRELTKNWK